jgi:hypothetical protein
MSIIRILRVARRLLYVHIHDVAGKSAVYCPHHKSWPFMAKRIHDTECYILTVQADLLSTCMIEKQIAVEWVFH